MKYLQKLSVIALVICTIASCGNETNRRRDPPWANGKVFWLESTGAKIYLPPSTKRSSRFRLETDLPGLAADSFILRSFQDALHLLDTGEGVTDVFVDTLQGGSLLIMKPLPERFPINKQTAAMLKAQVSPNFSINTVPGAESIELIQSKIQTSGTRGIATIKYKFQGPEFGTTYRTVYTFSTEFYTYSAMAWEDRFTDLGPYLWSLQEQ